MRSTCQRRLGGVTLVELLTVVSIIGILLVVAVPGMTDLFRNARMATQSDLLVSALNLTRLEAIKRRTDFKLCPAASPSTATDCSANANDWSNGWISIAPGGVINQRVGAKSGLVVTTASIGVTFNGTLGSASSATSFVLCMPGVKQQLIDVSLSGHVSKRIGTVICT